MNMRAACASIPRFHLTGVLHRFDVVLCASLGLQVALLTDNIIWRTWSPLTWCYQNHNDPQTDSFNHFHFPSPSVLQSPHRPCGWRCGCLNHCCFLLLILLGLTSRCFICSASDHGAARLQRQLRASPLRSVGRQRRWTESSRGGRRIIRAFAN